jgi:hypothetical protein
MEIQGNFYRCQKCSRITQTYPLGCRERECPVKKDVMNDWTYGFFLAIFLMVVFGVVFMYVFANAFSIPR